MTSVVPMIAYEDGTAAMDWLVEAFGFRRAERRVTPEGRLTHGEMRGGGRRSIMMATPTPDYQGPRHHRESCEAAAQVVEVPYIIDGVLVYVDDVEAHFERAARPERDDPLRAVEITASTASATARKTSRATAGCSCRVADGGSPQAPQGRPAQPAAPAQVRRGPRRRRGVQPPAREGQADRARAHRAPGRPQLVRGDRHLRHAPRARLRPRSRSACRATAWSRGWRRSTAAT